MDPLQTYTMVTKLFVAEGNDGFAAMQSAEIVRKYENYSALNCIQDYFERKDPGPFPFAGLSQDGLLVITPAKDGRLRVI